MKEKDFGWNGWKIEMFVWNIPMNLKNPPLSSYQWNSHLLFRTLTFLGLCHSLLSRSVKYWSNCNTRRMNQSSKKPSLLQTLSPNELYKFWSSQIQLDWLHKWIFDHSINIAIWPSWIVIYSNKIHMWISTHTQNAVYKI